MSLFDWFSEEAKEERKKKREALRRLQEQADRDEAERRLRIDAKRALRLLSDEPNDPLHDFISASRDVQEKLKSRKQNRAFDAEAARFSLILASAYLSVAEEFILVRPDYSDAYGLEFIEGQDVPSWPSLAREATVLANDALDLLVCGFGVVADGQELADEIRRRAKVVLSATPASLAEAGSKFVVFKWTQMPGAGDVTAAWIAMAMALRDKRLPVKVRTIGDFASFSQQLPEHSWLFRVSDA